MHFTWEKKNPTSVDIKKQGKLKKDFECVSVRAQERERFMVMRINSKQNQAFFHYAQK